MASMAADAATTEAARDEPGRCDVPVRRAGLVQAARKWLALNWLDGACMLAASGAALGVRGSLCPARPWLAGQANALHGSSTFAPWR